jgi:hypothetical protein
LAKTVIAAAAVLALAPAKADSTVQLLPQEPVALGDVFSVEIQGVDFVPIVGGGLDLSFSAGMLELLSVEIDPTWDFFSTPGDIDNDAGTLTGMSFNIWGQMSGDFTIATLLFQASATGSAVIGLSTSDDWPFATIAGQIAPVTLVGSYVQISSPIPEPAAWLMMLSGVGGLLGLMAKRPGRS